MVTTSDGVRWVVSLCISSNLLTGDLLSKLAAIKQAGFAYVDLTDSDIASFDGTTAALAQTLTDHGLSLVGMHGMHNLEGYSGEPRKQAFDRLQRKLDDLAKLGGDMLVVNASDDITSSTDEAQIVDDLHQMAEKAKQRDVKIAYRALPWAHVVSTNELANKLITQVNSPQLGMGINSCLMLVDGTKAAAARTYDISKLFHVELTDAQQIRASIDNSYRSALLPAQGVLNLAALIRILIAGNYSNHWTLSGVGNAVPTGDSLSLAQGGYRALVNVLDEVQRTDPAAQFGIPSMPSRVHATGFEFIEFAVDDSSKQELESLLATMGFRAERQHVSKQVVLWRQGAVNILLNSEKTGYARKAFDEHGPCVCDLAIRVNDAQATVERANALGTQSFSQVVADGELAIPAIKGVGGNVVHFIDEQSNLHFLWNIEFQPLEPSSLKRHTGIRRIDHIAQTTRYEDMQRFMLYYVSTFDMEKAAIVDIADPSGRVRSQAISSPEGEVRLTLNGVIDQSTMAGSFVENSVGAGVQHIALATDDIFETSTLLDESGFDRLSIPEQYYSNLQTQLSLSSEFVQRLQSANILYSRSSHGEFFQIYSKTVLTGLFFEIVQRKNGYQGYGARNSAVRLNAQLASIMANGNG